MRGRPDPQPLLPPAEAAHVVRSALPVGCEAVWVTRGQYAPEPAVCQRVLVLARAGDRVHTAADVWQRAGDETALAACLGEGFAVWVGENDAMYATPWQYAWVSDAGTVEVWCPEGPVLWFDDCGALVVRGQDPRTATTVVGVEGWLSPDWTERGVRLRIDDGPPVDVAHRVEPTAAFDPAYDVLDLLCDASWVGALATVLGRALGVPVTLDPALR